MRNADAAMVVGALVAATSFATADDPWPFTSEAPARGVTYTIASFPPFQSGQHGYGLSIADLDGDGDLDLVALGRTNGMVGVFENDGSGHFLNRSFTSELLPSLVNASVLAFDFDRDADLDLFIGRTGVASSLYRNDGNLVFTDVTASSGIAATLPVTGLAAADFDGDGWIDLFACNYDADVENQLWRNRGDGTFEEVAAALGFVSTARSFQAAWSDFDRDSWPDLYVSNDRGVGAGANELHRNRGDGTFEEIGAACGADVALCSMGLAAGDVDGDLRPDYYLTNLPGASPPLFGANPLLLGSTSGVFEQAQVAWGVDHHRMSWGTCFWDFDNDADLDLFVVNENQPNTLYRNEASPPMTELEGAAGLAGSSNLAFASAFGDLDGDGDLDLVVSSYGEALRIYMNHEGARRSWLRVRIAGEGRVRDAAGASATLVPRKSKGRLGSPQWREVLVGGNSYLGQNEATLHFGLGDAIAADSIEVQWPCGGATRTLRNLAANRAWTAYPPSRLGDVDGDGVVDANDWSAFLEWGLGPLEPGREMLDFDGDGELDGADVAAFWERCVALRGDLDASGTVGGADLAVLLGSWGSGASPADLDLDGLVGGSDLAILLGNWGGR
ncbi:MAG: FG-GAP-like repeat-containing protein [Phycisphaerales bacterium]